MTIPAEVPYGTLDLMVLKTLDAMGPLHGYGIARRIEQIAEGALALNQGTIYPALLRLEQKGWISSEWGTSENNRRARFYAITRAGRKQLAAETESWTRTVAMVNRLLGGRVVTRLRVLRSRLCALFGRSRRDAELSEESTRISSCSPKSTCVAVYRSMRPAWRPGGTSAVSST